MRTKRVALGIVTIVGIGGGIGLLLSDTESGARSRSPGAEASTRQDRHPTSLAASGRAPAPRREAKESSGLPKARPLALGAMGPLHREAPATGAAAFATAHGGVAALTSSRKVAGARGAEATDEVGADKDARRERALQALANVDWAGSLRDLVAGLKSARAERRGLDVDTALEVARINVALTEAARALGLRTPGEALADPTVRSAVVPGWLDALGVDLSPDEAAAVASACLTVPAPNVPASATFLDARQAAVQSRLGLEQALGRVLTPGQMNAYYAGLPDDPLMRGSSPGMSLSAATPDALAQSVASCWASTFQLGPSSQQAAQQAAAQFVASVLAMPPPAPNMDPATLRTATLDHATQLAGLQKQAEQALAASPLLTDAERGRATRGAGYGMKLTLSPAAQGK